MGKRSNFERRDRDFYPTPMAAVLPLLPFLPSATRFVEPCYGEGHLARHLEAWGHKCVAGTDVETDARTTRYATVCDAFITNPPWERSLLHPIIRNLSSQAPTWLLFDADWVHTRQASPFLNRLRKIVSVGRVKWIEDSTMTGKDNCAWHLFDKPCFDAPTFHGRKH